MSQLNDISLVAQVVAFKNTKAFDQLVKKYQSPVRRFFLNQTCGDSELSDDLAQDTFIKAYTHIASFKNLSSFSTWLYRIAYNIFYDYIRSRKDTVDLDSYEVDRMYKTEQENFGQKQDIYQSLKTLKEVERTCVTLFYMEGVSIDKIAEITGCPPGTVKSHLSRGKEKLATYLKQNGYDGNER
ncbi:MAG: sigma-70 family RNA polymerase sigma factor [Mediterranea sp.]|jgi:RNA polymerase sigma-70 factor (ECF subfamily)|nr:sigma-70 family RNA polymerase sigma factor [Mediterranea sp.]